MYDPNANAAPFNPLPPVIWALAALILVPEVILSLAERGLIGGPSAVGWRSTAIQSLGFFDPLFDWMLVNWQFPIQGTYRLFSYPLVGDSFVSALIAAVILLALGNVVGRVFSALSVCTVFVLSTCAGALTFGLLEPSQELLIGAFPPVYGVMGMYSFALLQIAKRRGDNPANAFRLPIALIIFQLIFWVAFGAIGSLSADIGGFAAGFGLSFLVGPGSAARIRGWRNRLRNR
ncbi:MAG: rhomboid family intramembrane serine protease [Pseudomonadota bacterium]